MSLTRLRRDNAAKSCLFEKYIHMHFVDKNPEGMADDPPLDDESEWENRVIINVAWWRSNGYVVLTKMINVPASEQVIEKYLINETLHQMIRNSSHNVKTMASQMNVAPAQAPLPAAAAAPAGADAASATAVVAAV